MEITETALHREKTSPLERLQIADGLMLLIVFAGGLMRFFHLHALPLNEAEAELTYAVWRFWQPDTAALTISSPAYFSLTAPLTQLLGFSDTIMRLVPALFGTAVVALPWLLRHRLGNLGMLVMSIILAAAPLPAITARSAGGEAIAIFAISLLAIALLRYFEAPHGRWLTAAAVALGVGLASAPLFYTGVVALGIAAVLQKRIGGILFPEAASISLRPGRRELIALGAAFVGLSTLFLWYPQGLGHSVTLLGEWVTAFTGQNGRSVLDPLLALGRYAPALPLLALPIIIRGILRGRAFTLWGLYALAALLVLLVLQQGVMANAALFILPTSLIVADYAQEQAQKIGRLTIGVSALIFLGIGLLALNFARYSRILLFNNDDLLIITVIFLAITVGGLALYFLATWDPALTTRAFFFALLAAILYFNWGTAWWLGQEAGNDPRELWVAAGTDESVRLMHSMLLDIANQTRNSSSELAISSAVDSAVLRWYLRDFHSVEFGETVPVMNEYDVVITAADPNQPLAASYIGTDFKYRLAGVLPQEAPSLTPVFDTVRWWLFHESRAAIHFETIIVWIRGDLISEQ